MRKKASNSGETKEKNHALSHDATPASQPSGLPYAHQALALLKSTISTVDISQPPQKLTSLSEICSLTFPLLMLLVIMSLHVNQYFKCSIKVCVFLFIKGIVATHFIQQYLVYTAHGSTYHIHMVRVLTLSTKRRLRQSYTQSLCFRAVCVNNKNWKQKPKQNR